MKTVDFLPYEQFAQLSNAEKDEYVSSKAAELKVGIKNKEYVKIENASPIPQHEYVDLGLPNGTLWATCNLGAETPEETGLYFQWADISGYTVSQIGTDKTFDLAHYKYCNGDVSGMTKYCPTSQSGWWGGSGEPDNKLILDTEDDAATSNWGSNWEIPSNADFEELTGNTTTAWTQVDGVYGMLFTSTANTNTLFLPAAGYGIGGEHYYLGSSGYYWSRYLVESTPCDAWSLYVSDNDDCGMGYDCRFYGYSVRPVWHSNL